MKKKRCTEQQIAFALRQAESGTPVGEIVRKMGIAEATFYRWKQKFDGMGVGDGRGYENWSTRTVSLVQLERIRL